MRAVNTDARSTTDSRMMTTAEQIAPRRNVTCPAHPSRAWDGMTGPLRVGVIGANPNRSWAKDSHIPALRSLENVQLAAVATTRASARRRRS
jgi:hypothetical protein